MPITAAIFDFDGTLASSLEGIFKCMSETLAHHGFNQPTLEEVRRTIGAHPGRLHASAHARPLP